MRTLLPVLFGLVLATAVAAAEPPANAERIHSYHSDIRIQPDGSMLVTETITVTALGDEIKRGIYRDFPTRYRDPAGNNYSVGFEVQGVTRDGKPEPWHKESLRNGIRVYAGNKDYFLGKGRYTYTFAYHTDRQLGFFPDHDELYWNVTGNDWAFPIDDASAQVSLPAAASVGTLRMEAYTGRKGVKGKGWEAQSERSGSASFRTTKPLRSGEGLTIVLGFPKGMIPELTREQKLTTYVKDNLGNAIAVLGAIAVFAYYFIVWSRVGKDPPKGRIVQTDAPPPEPAGGGDQLSPAAMRFIMRQGFDHLTFTAGLINMAVKGYVKLTKEGGDYRILRDWADEGVLSPEEAKLAEKLLSGRKSISVTQGNHVRLSSAIKAFRNALQLKYEKTYFVTNRTYLLPGIALSAAAMIGAVVSQPAEQAGIAGFLCVWLSIWSLGVGALAIQVVNAWRQARSRRTVAAVIGAVFLSLFAMPFFLGEVFGIVMLGANTSLVAMAAIGIIGAMNALFYQLLKAPTLLGRRLMDQIEGFALYLENGGRLFAGNSSSTDATAQFERFLPYAIALGKSDEWSEGFTNAATAAGAGPGDTEYRPGIYQPLWYGGNDWDAGQDPAFFSGLGSSFSSAMSSAATAPGSSSGGGGGGSSGGGGGGGGGGGW